MKRSFLKVAGTVAVVSALTLSGSVAWATDTDSVATGSSVAKTAKAPSFKTPTISKKLKNTTLPVSVNGKKLKFSVKVNGAKASTDISYSFTGKNNTYPRVTVVAKNKKMPSSAVMAPRLGTVPYPVKVGNNSFTFEMKNYHTPGKYKVTIPVRQGVYNKSTYASDYRYKQKSKTITVRANKKYSKEQTSVYGSARAKKTFPLVVTAPAYQAGAKVEVYYKAKGQKKYKKVRTGTLKNNKGYSSRAKINISKKHNLGGRDGKLYLKIGKVAYSSAYKSEVYDIEKY